MENCLRVPAASNHDRTQPIPPQSHPKTISEIQKEGLGSVRKVFAVADVFTAVVISRTQVLSVDHVHLDINVQQTILNQPVCVVKSPAHCCHSWGIPKSIMKIIPKACWTPGIDARILESMLGFWHHIWKLAFSPWILESITPESILAFVILVCCKSSRFSCSCSGHLSY